MSRLSLVAAGVADDNGNLSVTFDAPPLGKVFTGAVAVPNAPTDAALQVFIGSANALPLGSFIGQQGFTGVQAYPNERVVVAGAGFAPGTQYSASFVGSVDDEQNAPPVSPASAPNPGGGKAVVNFLNFVRDTFALVAVVIPNPVATVADPFALIIGDSSPNFSTASYPLVGPSDTLAPVLSDSTPALHT